MCVGRVHVATDGTSVAPTTRPRALAQGCLRSAGGCSRRPSAGIASCTPRWIHPSRASEFARLHGVLGKGHWGTLPDLATPSTRFTRVPGTAHFKIRESSGEDSQGDEYEPDVRDRCAPLRDLGLPARPPPMTRGRAGPGARMIEDRGVHALVRLHATPKLKPWRRRGAQVGPDGVGLKPGAGELKHQPELDIAASARIERDA